MLGLAGIDPGPADDVPEEATELLSQREEARAAGDFARADALRGQLRDLGFEITDTPDGPQVARTPGVSPPA